MNLSKMKLVLACLGITLSSNVYALGVVNGGGGMGVVCRNTDQSILSVQLLDLWEGQVLRGQLPLKQTGDLKAAIDSALENLSNSFPIRITSNCTDRECTLRDMREIAAGFLSKDSGVVRLHDVKLERTSDAMEVAEPKDCAIEQIVNYQRASAPVLLNQDLFEKMDITNQAALISHEALYGILRKYAGESNSIRTRRAVSYAFSGGKFVWPTTLHPKPNDKLIKCSSPNQNGAGGIVLGTSIQITPDLKKIYPSVVFGAPLMAIKPIDISKNNYGMKDMLSTVCRGHDMLMHLDGQLEDAVEFDRELTISNTCENGKNVLSIHSRAPGEADFRSVALKCKLVQLKN